MHLSVCNILATLSFFNEDKTFVNKWSFFYLKTYSTLLKLGLVEIPLV